MYSVWYGMDKLQITAINVQFNIKIKQFFVKVTYLYVEKGLNLSNNVLVATLTRYRRVKLFIYLEIL